MNFDRYKLIVGEVLDLYPNVRDINILDCGCGYGEVITLLENKGFGILGVEKDPLRLAYCWARHMNVKEASVTKLPVKDKIVDVLICSEVLEHLTQEEFGQTISEFNRVLKKSGILIITTPEREKDILKDPKHKRLVTFDELKNSFKGFDVLKNEVIYKNQKCRDEDSGNLFLVLRRKNAKNGLVQ